MKKVLRGNYEIKGDLKEGPVFVTEVKPKKKPLDAKTSKSPTHEAPLIRQ